MRQVALYTLLLVAGLVGSQFLPGLSGPRYVYFGYAIQLLTMTGLAFIMIRVGLEFQIDKSRPGQYGWDYVVAFTAASFPWAFVSAYFVFVLLPSELWSDPSAWKETLLAGRFAAPTSAGVLFSMLAAAGLGATWLFKKARVLAIFDDLDTVLLMIPLKMMMVGLAWQLGLAVVFMIVLLVLAYVFMNRLAIPITWQWVLFYAFLIGGLSEVIYLGTTIIDPDVPIHIEVLLPAFVLGVAARPPEASDPRHIQHAIHEMVERPEEQRAGTIVSAVFMVCVGLSMPLFVDGTRPAEESAAAPAARPESLATQASEAGQPSEARMTVTASQPPMGFWAVVWHVIVVTILSNIGKMFPAFCYRREAHWRERLGVAIGMWPRGEVGAGVLVVSLSYNIGGPIVTIAMLSLALNLALTGLFIVIVKWLIAPVVSAPEAT